MGQEMWQIDPQDADQYIFLRAQYVWGPGDSPTNGVDELLCQIQGNSPSELGFGTNNKKWYVLTDAQGDVASLVHVPTANAAAQVAGQWTYSPYGEVLTCDQLSAHPAVVFGHKTLAVDRLDAPAVSWDENAWRFADTKRLIPGSDLLTYARNRSGRPKLGRWMQGDPNASGLLVNADLGYHGATPTIGTLALSVQSRMGDGLSLYGYSGINPVVQADPTGLFFSLPGMLMSGMDAMDNVSSQFDEALSGLRTAFGLSAMLDSYQFNQEMAMDFALDWNSSDDLLNKINMSGASASVISASWAAGEQEFKQPNPQDYLAYNGPHHNMPTSLGGTNSLLNIIETLQGEDHNRFHRVLEENFRRNSLNPPNSRGSNRWITRMNTPGAVSTSEKNSMRRAIMDSARDFDALTQNKYKLRERTRITLSHPSVSGKLISTGGKIRKLRR